MTGEIRGRDLIPIPTISFAETIGDEYAVPFSPPGEWVFRSGTLRYYRGKKGRIESRNFTGTGRIGKSP